MPKILGLSLLALVVLAVLIAMAVVNIRDYLVPKSPPQAPEEARGPFTRPGAPANPGVVRTSRDPDHTHMRSGTIAERPPSGPRPEPQPSPRRTSQISTNLRTRSQENDPFQAVRRSFDGVGASMNDMSRSIHEALMGQSPAAPGVVVRVTTTEEVTRHPSVSPGLVAQERRILAEMLKARENEKPPPKVERVSRYKRKPVI
jgi:hypothetical protein